jgi:hypothetical protein
LNNDLVGTYDLQEGDNTISIPLENFPSGRKYHTLLMRFKYSLPMKIRPIGPWGASVFLLDVFLN